MFDEGNNQNFCHIYFETISYRILVNVRGEIFCSHVYSKINNVGNI